MNEHERTSPTKGLVKSADILIEKSNPKKIESEEVATRFKPYDDYIRAVKEIDEFVQFTGYSYILTQQLLARHQRAGTTLPLRSAAKAETISYSSGDSATVVKFIRGWLPIESYAKREGLSAEEVEKQLGAGKLGPIRRNPATNTPMIIWPPECQELDPEELPEPGKHMFEVTRTIAVTAARSLESEFNAGKFDDIENELLAHVHSLGGVDEVSDRVQAKLYRSAFLLQWTAFEVLIRQSAKALLLKHPRAIFSGKHSGKKMTRAEVFDIASKSGEFRDIAVSLIEDEISAIRGVNDIINFLKETFRFKKDPYHSWYVYKDQRRETSYVRLAELRELRNALVHDLDAGQRASTIDNVDIDESRYQDARLMLRAIAFSIAKSVASDEYRLAYS